MPLLAHSARPNLGIPFQEYQQHIAAVQDRAVSNAREAARFWRTSAQDRWIESIRSAACLHDLGKLDKLNQQVLRTSSKGGLPVRHEDAGVLRLLLLKQWTAALLVHSHHAGLPNYEEETSRGPQFLRQAALTEDYVNQYLKLHESVCSFPDLTEAADRKRAVRGLGLRIALSCLVDADHGDTAQHYHQEPDVSPTSPRWSERITALDQHVAALSSQDKPGFDAGRQKIRQMLYRACRERSLAESDRIVACDSPVGTGKTLALMAHALQVARERGLRNIFVVLPYTNIITQSVRVYRDALTLDREDPNRVVAAHHHQADYESVEGRLLATNWGNPVTVTTAVQFFETLGSCQTGRLRKLHHLPGSVIVLDEAHAALPAWMWRQSWSWLNELVWDWNCHLVLASGSLPRFWDLEDAVGAVSVVPQLVQEPERAQANAAERRRVSYQRHSEPLDLAGLTTFLQEILSSGAGPCLAIFNTVQTAAVVSQAMESAGISVEHLSTALAPIHRDQILERVKQRLSDSQEKNWILVATSCVEAGVDISFRTGVREACTIGSLLQIAGRVNRHGEFEDATVWSVNLRVGSGLTHHPEFLESAAHLNYFFDKNLLETLSADELMTRALEREAQWGQKRSEELRQAELQQNYPEVSRLNRVINTDTVVAVIDADLAEKILRFQPVCPRDVMAHSVQIWSSKISRFSLAPLREKDRLYRWTLAYDAELLGTMAGVLEMLRAENNELVMA